MKIIVCMKQVPASSKVDIDPETGNLKRGSAGQRTNPYDLYALECALQIREKTGGTVTVLTMGPGQAESMIRDAYSMGADEGVILSDRKFSGSDVLATSYALSQGIEMLGGADLILCGRQTTDGDTAQIGPAIAEHLHIPHCAWVSAIEEADEEQITVKTGFWKRDPDFPDALSLPGYCGQGYLRSETSILASEQRDERPTGARGNL